MGKVPGSREDTEYLAIRRVASTVPSIQEASGSQESPDDSVPVRCQAIERVPNGQESAKQRSER